MDCQHDQVAVLEPADGENGWTQWRIVHTICVDCGTVRLAQILPRELEAPGMHLAVDGQVARRIGSTPQ